ncbi:MAG: undecaprenyl/decaprenyl-phosphate alpha-N-acetylglucosaminyl 1-phosphate transferase, partial [Oligoflexia bacterium]|nr:undecaprenyl/decaprenyl-phosphate alpha-N-acetylglucosaminyl 1-phosphate transferase [Oligoflexia bacterium]
YLGLLLGSIVIFIFGLVDDIFKLRPHYKILGQLLSIGIASYLGIAMHCFSSQIFSLFVTIFWFLAISNAFNLLDNMDGLSSGIAISSALVIAFQSWLQNNETLFVISLIFASSLFGFWLLNKNPAKIFMGDCGSQFIGFFLAGLSILGTWKDASNLILTLVFPMLVLAVPIFDTTYVSIMRKFHGKKITDGGKDHLSHRLVALGLSEKRAVNTLIFIGLTVGLTTVFVLHYFDLYLGMALIPLVLIAFSLLGLFCLK